MSRRLVATSALVILVVAGLFLLSRPAARRGRRVRATPAASVRGAGMVLTEAAASQPEEAGAPLVPSGQPADPQVVRQIQALVQVHLEARAKGDAAALRRELSVVDIWDDMMSEDPQATARPAWYVPLEPSEENLDRYEQNLVDDLLRESPDERRDFAEKAQVTHVVPLVDGRYLVRMYAESVLATRASRGRELPDQALTGFLPTERRMVVALRDGAWKVVGFPRRDRQPPLEGAD